MHTRDTRVHDITKAVILAHREDLARSLPVGVHPFDLYLRSLVDVLGKDQAAAFLGIPQEGR